MPGRPPRIVNLEHEPEAHLNRPGPAAAQDLPGVGFGITTVTRVSNRRTGIAKVEMIERIEEVAAELQPQAFSESERLHGTHVPVPRSRAKQQVWR